MPGVPQPARLAARATAQLSAGEGDLQGLPAGHDPSVGEDGLALAGRCAYQQDPKAFWKMYDAIYDNQDVILASNVYDKVLDFASRAANPEVF